MTHQVEGPNTHPDTWLKVHLVCVFAPVSALQDVPALPAKWWSKAEVLWYITKESKNRQDKIMGGYVKAQWICTTNEGV